MRRVIPALAVGIAFSAQAAPADPLAWLQRAAKAARQASYEGTYVHTNGERISTVRITHVMSGSEEHERIEPLDGDSVEIVRRNDEMFCRFPDAKTVRLDPRITARFFPGILGATAESISASYDVKLGKTERWLASITEGLLANGPCEARIGWVAPPDDGIGEQPPPSVRTRPSAWAAQ